MMMMMMRMMMRMMVVVVVVIESVHRNEPINYPNPKAIG
jgi:hypothetical protein